MSAELGMPIDLVLVRHGESEGNIANELSKLGDDSLWTSEFSERHSSKHRLTVKGREQAEQAGRWIREHIGDHFDFYYASEYLRAQETAGLLGMPGAMWLTETYLRERDMGMFVGRSDMERKRYVEENRYSKSDSFYWAPPAGESIAHCLLRVDRFLDSLSKHCSGMRVLVVCHGNIMRAFRVRLERMTQTQFSEWNASDHVGNGQIMWYSRRDPTSLRVGPLMKWTLSALPTEELERPFPWREIKRLTFSNEDLLAHVATVPAIWDGQGLEERICQLKEGAAASSLRPEQHD